LKALKGLDTTIVGMEPTGHYWVNLSKWLYERNDTTAIVPLQIGVHFPIQILALFPYKTLYINKKRVTNSYTIWHSF
jgi:hypothetical protein